MPIEVSYTVVPRDIMGFSSPIVITGYGPKGGVPKAKKEPVQLGGLVGMTDCDADECRDEFPGGCCYKNPVFGQWTPAGGGGPGSATSSPAYENDFNAFWLDMALYGTVNTTTVTWTLEKCVNDEWVTQATLNNNNYGTYYALNSLLSKGHPTYTGYLINWGLVGWRKGAGCYRIKATTLLRGGSAIVGCKVSKAFELLKWDCNRAHGTVKFETTLSGKIGNHLTPGKLVDFCGLSMYDSVRVRGFFGYETTPQFLEVMHQWQTGLLDQVRDEGINRYKYISEYLPKDLHDRFKHYALKADALLVSDYNRNNSDYNIRRLGIRKVGAYEPTYLDKQRRRLSKVTCEFGLRTEYFIKTNCCDVAANGSRT